MDGPTITISSEAVIKKDKNMVINKTKSQRWINEQIELFINELMKVGKNVRKVFAQIFVNLRNKQL